MENISSLEGREGRNVLLAERVTSLCLAAALCPCPAHMYPGWGQPGSVAGAPPCLEVIFC